MASRSWKVSCIVKQELMQTRMISLLVEWCETDANDLQLSVTMTYALRMIDVVPVSQ